MTSKMDLKEFFELGHDDLKQITMALVEFSKMIDKFPQYEPLSKELLNLAKGAAKLASQFNIESINHGAVTIEQEFEQEEKQREMEGEKKEKKEKHKKDDDFFSAKKPNAPISPVHQLKKKVPSPTDTKTLETKLESNMNIESLIALADKFDMADEEVAANQIDELIKKMAAELNLPEYAPEFTPTLSPQWTSEDKWSEINEIHALTDSFKKFLETPTMSTHDALVNLVGKYMARTKEEGVIASTQTSLEKLASMADKLDSIGAVEEANMIDEFISKNAEMLKNADKKKKDNDSYDTKEHHSKQVREPKREQERVDREGRKDHHVHTYQETGASGLSTRYCPEHVGVMLGRIGDNTYQCSLDGQIYNWETGWTDYDGNKHPGGSVAAQTPGASEYAIPHRIFDSREKILNTIT